MTEGAERRARTRIGLGRCSGSSCTYVLGSYSRPDFSTTSRGSMSGEMISGGSCLCGAVLHKQHAVYIVWQLDAGCCSGGA